MANFNKAYNLRIISIFVSVVLLSIAIFYTETYSQEALRLPIGIDTTHKRINLANALESSGYKIGEVDRDDTELITNLLKEDEKYKNIPVLLRDTLRQRGLSRLLIEYCQSRFNSIVLYNGAPIEFRDKMSDQYMRLGFRETDVNVFIWDKNDMEDSTNCLEYEIREINRSDEATISQILKRDDFFANNKTIFLSVLMDIQHSSKKLIALMDVENSEPMGYVLVSVYENNGVYLEKIFIAPEYRRNGYSDLLLKYCKDNFDAIALQNTTSDIALRHKMAEKYRNSGFTEIDTDIFEWHRATLVSNLRKPLHFSKEYSESTILLEIKVDPNQMKPKDYSKITVPFMDAVQEWIGNLPRDTDSIATFKWAKSVLDKSLDVFLGNAYDSVVMSGRTGRIFARVILDGNIVTVVVDDEGDGIPEDEISLIFHKIIKSKKISLDKDLWGKAGRDLRWLYTQIKALGGTITAYNKIERGAIFKCSIPVFEDRVNMKRRGIRTENIVYIEKLPVLSENELSLCDEIDIFVDNFLEDLTWRREKGDFLPSSSEKLIRICKIIDIPKKAKVLDPGSGTGKVCFLLAIYDEISLKRDIEITGIEYESDFFNLSRGYRNGLGNRYDSVRRIKLINDNFFEYTHLWKDFDIIFYAARGCNEEKRLAEEIIKHLKPGAQFLMYSSKRMRNFIEDRKESMPQLFDIELFDIKYYVKMETLVFTKREREELLNENQKTLEVIRKSL